MPMTLNVGLSRKVGEANYGSRGASVNFAVELEASLIREPDEYAGCEDGDDPKTRRRMRHMR